MLATIFFTENFDSLSLAAKNRTIQIVLAVDRFLMYTGSFPNFFCCWGFCNWSEERHFLSDMVAKLGPFEKYKNSLEKEQLIIIKSTYIIYIPETKDTF